MPSRVITNLIAAGHSGAVWSGWIFFEGRSVAGRGCPMEMHQIRYFLAVSKTLNFTQAAEDCHVAQPSLSRAIIKLEEELGGELFRRERGLTHVTDLGRMMLPLLTQCFESANAAKQLAASYKKGSCAPLRLALSHTVNLQLLIQPLTELVKAFPGLELKFVRSTAPQVEDALKSGEAELGIACPLANPWDRLDAWVLFTERFGLVTNATHPLAMRNKLSLSDINGVRLLPRVYAEEAAELEAVLLAHGVGLEFQDAICSDHDLTALLVACVGVAIVPQSSCASDALRFLTIEDLELTRPVVLYAVAGRQRSPAATGLIRLLRSTNWAARLNVHKTLPGSGESSGSTFRAAIGQ